MHRDSGLFVSLLNARARDEGRGLHSSTSQLYLSRF